MQMAAALKTNPAQMPAELTERSAAAWLMLGVAALGASTLFALLLVISRTPYVGALLPGHDFFRTALVLHVNLSTLIWFLASAGMLWNMLRPGSRVMSVAAWFAGGGALAMLISSMMRGGRPLLNNYLPMLDHPMFIGGLLLFALGVLLAALRFLLSMRPGRLPQPSVICLYAAALVLLLALGSLAWSYLTLPRLAGASYYEVLFWSLGHILQFCFTFMMLGAWLRLAEEAGMAVRISPAWCTAIALMGLLPLVAVPMLHLQYEVASVEFRKGFTDLMRYGSWISAVPIALLILAGMRRRPSPLTHEQRPALTALLLSMLMFACGMGVGSMIRADNTLVPAHYHGVIGAVTLALMGLSLSWLPRLGFLRPAPRLASWQARLYAGGTLMMVAGLAWTGVYGMARKVPGSQQILAGSRDVAGMLLMGLGGLIAVSGSLMFVVLVYRAIRQRRESPAVASDSRPFALALAFGLIAVLGSVVAVMPVSVNKPLPLRIDPNRDPDGHARAAARSELDQRFRQGVAMLNAQQYEHAVTALHRVLELDPTLVEGHVNMGYAMLGLKQYKFAFDFFESATELRPMQANAYYGMAIAMEELGDLPGAVGAMSTFLHLAEPENSYRRKAESALWEWEERLKQERSKETAESAAKAP